MKKIIYKIILFSCIFLLTISLYVTKAQEILINAGFVDTELQIQQNFDNSLQDNYDTYIFGNSRMYRGVNPKQFNKFNVYNFSHDNDTYNQIYYKMLWLDKKGIKYDNIILGVDYFQFSFLSDTRNDYYKKFLGKDYLSDYPKTKITIKEDFLNMREKIRLAVNVQLGITKNITQYRLEKNGWYHEINNKVATGKESIERDSTILDIQMNYFEKIVHYAKDNNINLIMVMPPLRQEELSSYNLEIINKFNEIFNSYVCENIYYFNLSEDSNFSIEDFEDITHLNSDGANKFSKMLNKYAEDFVKKQQ